MTDIGVIGYGVVGRAVAHGLKHVGHRVYVNDVVKIDHSTVSKQWLAEHCDVNMICVGTPESKTHMVENVLRELNAHQPQHGRKPLTVIKSTVLPGATDQFAKQFKRLRLAVNPEFLRLKSAAKDFAEPDRIVLGTYDQRDCEELREVYRRWKCPIYNLSPTEAEMVKQLSNAYLVLKVAFALEASKVADRAVLKAVGADRRINWSHLDPTLGRISRNTPCLYKDLTGLLGWFKERGVATPLLDEAHRGGIEP